MAKLYNDIADEGATYELEFTWTDESGNVIDLTGFLLRFAIKRTADDDTDLLRLTEESAEVTITAASGTVNIKIPPAAAIPAGRWPWSCQLENEVGDVWTVFDGHITYRARVA